MALEEATDLSLNQTAEWMVKWLLVHSVWIVWLMGMELRWLDVDRGPCWRLCCVTCRTESTSMLPHDIPYFVDRRQSETRRSVILSRLRVMRSKEQLVRGEL
jgi:hypothetical protein